LQPLRWHCAECAIHHERNVRDEQLDEHVARTDNNRVIAVCDLYCCLLPQCEALRTCLSGFPIATVFLKTCATRLFPTHTSYPSTLRLIYPRLPGVAAHDSLFVLLRPGFAVPSRARAQNYPTEQNKESCAATPGNSSV